MTNFLIIGICIIAGMLFRKSKTLPVDTHKGINAWIIYLALPAVSFKYLPDIHWSKELLFPALAPIVVWFVGWALMRIYSSKANINKPTEGGLKLSSSLSNTSFLGFPLVMAYFSKEDIAIAVICDQVTFLLLATVGVIVAINSSNKQKLSPSIIINKITRFPPFLGCIAALTIPRYVDISPLAPLFDTLAGTVAPLALFSIGLQLQFEGWQAEIKNVSIVLLYKLIPAPAIILLIAIGFQLSGKITQITIFEMAMPSFLSAGVVANDYNLSPKLTNLIIGFGILISFITTAVWFWILQYLL